MFADAAELVREKVDLLAVAGPELPLQAALAASLTTPIVFAAINYDPIARGYVKGLAQPGGNATGFFLRQTELAEKQVELLAQALPGRLRSPYSGTRLRPTRFTPPSARRDRLAWIFPR